MSSKTDNKEGGSEKQTEGEDKPNSSKAAKAADLERIRQKLAKRSLNVKFDLQGSDYKPIENIGIGAYGVVCSAIHSKSGDRVAIKKIPSVFEALTVAKRTYREIKILKHFKHDNIISIREILLPKENVKDFKDIYVVFDLMESDLHRIIYSKQELSEEHIRYFLYQILRGLKYIHSANVIHRDLKPSNLLVNEDCHLRIGDFGMARGMFYTPNEPSYYMTQYVATRWYRAPEILLSLLEYGTAVDMWSVGCIFAEMMGRKHLFPGKDYMAQVKLILGVLGTPSESVLKNCHNDILRRIIKGLGKKDPISWEKLFPKASKKSLDLLGQMLVLNPADRISVERALSHRLLNTYHCPDDEPICVPTFNFDFEKEDMDKPRLRGVIMEEIMSFHQPKQPTLSFNAFLRPAPKSETPSFKSDKTDAEDVTVMSQGLENAGDKQTTEYGSVAIFKTPSSAEGKTSTKVSPVSVDVGRLQVSESADIEMLSAQSSDGRAMDTQSTDVILVSMDKTEQKPATAVKEEKRAGGEKDGKAAAAEKKGGSTISEDTRAKVKQALMNANRRQRAESQGEDVKETKPVTAAQRQREREEKRRKKKERALEKVKKSKDKKAVQEQSMTLSSQDMELLRRWTIMQKPSSPSHPEPAVSPPQGAGTAENSNNNSSSSRNSTGANSSQSIEISVATQQGGWGNQASTTTGNKPRQILAKTTAMTSVTTVNITSSQINSGGSVFIPTTQLSLGQSNFIPVIAIPSTVNPGKIEIKRILHAQTAAPPPAPSSMQASDSTKTLLQNAILMRNRGTPANTASQSINTQSVNQDSKSSDAVRSENLNQSAPTSMSFPSGVGSETTPHSQASIVHGDQFNIPVASDPDLLKPSARVMSKDDKLSPRSLGNDLLDFLNELKDSPKEKPVQAPVNVQPVPPHYHGSGSSFVQSQCIQDENSLFSVGGPSPKHSPQHSLTPPPPYNPNLQTQDSEEQPSRSNSTPVLLRHNSHSPSLPNRPSSERPQRSSVPIAAYGNQQPFSSSFPNQSGFPSGFQTANTSNFSSNSMSEASYQNFGQPPSVITFDTHIPHANMLFQTSSDFSSQLQQQPQQQQQQQQQQQHQQQQQRQQHQQQQQMFETTGHYTDFSSFPGASSSANPSMQFDQNFTAFPPSQSQQQNFGLNPNFQSTSFAGASSQSQALGQQQVHSQNLPLSNLQSTGASGTSNPGQYNSSLLQHSLPGPSGAGPSNPSNRLTVNCGHPSRRLDTGADLIALLSKQFSRSQVVDIFPPALALTPKGTGAGYGVGMDLDNMLTDAQDHASVRVEQSPLSSSLLADWLDISGQISQADLEALERDLALQSPMHVSYNDVNM